MRLRNAPLVHVLAQVTFPSLPKWEDRVEDLRERMVDLGFPRGQRVQTQEITLALEQNAARPAMPLRPTTLAHWEFGDRTQRTGFVFSDTMLVLHTSAYQSSVPFLEMLRRGLDAVAATWKMSVVDRLGLRYIDFIQPKPNEHVGKYVHPGLLGYPFGNEPKLQAKRGAFMTQSIALTPHGTLAIRSGVVPPGNYLTPDLVGQVNLRPPEHVDRKRGGMLVDFDHYTMFRGESAQPLDFDPPVILAHLQQLHTSLRLAFAAVITPHALDVWGPWEPVSGDESRATTMVDSASAAAADRLSPSEATSHERS